MTDSERPKPILIHRQKPGKKIKKFNISLFLIFILIYHCAYVPILRLDGNISTIENKANRIKKK